MRLFRNLHGTPSFLLALVCALVLAAPGSARAEDEREPVDPETAYQDLEELEGYLKRSRNVNNSEIEQYLRVVFNAYNNFIQPEEPVREDFPEGEEGDDAFEDTHKDWETEMRKLGRKQEKFDDDVEDALFDALDLHDIERGTNQRDDVNALAAELIGRLAPYVDEKKAGKLTKEMTRAINSLEDAEWAASYVVERMFLAIAHLNHEDGLEWILDEFTHNKKQDDVVMRMRAAHAALTHFTDVPGRMRYQVVEEFIKVYAGTEATANNNDPNNTAAQTIRAFWDKIKIDVIKVLQYYAGNPENEQGQVFNTVQQFQEWFRDNDNVRRAPWVDA